MVCCCNSIYTFNPSDFSESGNYDVYFSVFQGSPFYGGDSYQSVISIPIYYSYIYKPSVKVSTVYRNLHENYYDFMFRVGIEMDSVFSLFNPSPSVIRSREQNYYLNGSLVYENTFQYYQYFIGFATDFDENDNIILVPSKYSVAFLKFGYRHYSSKPLTFIP